jgi:hypothetical protein
MSNHRRLDGGGAAVSVALEPRQPVFLLALAFELFDELLFRQPPGLEVEDSAVPGTEFAFEELAFAALFFTASGRDASDLAFDFESPFLQPDIPPPFAAPHLMAATV